jgi:phage regulator Rha-like protein
MAKGDVVKFDENVLKDRIYSIRGFQVMLDSDLAELYGVETKYLNRVMKRNSERFPGSFCYQLSETEVKSLRCHFVTIKNEGRGHHRKYLPYVFTQEGVAMLSAVLKSETAIKISIIIIEAFVAMRKFIQSNAQVFKRLDRVEVKLLENDQKFNKVFDALESKDRIPDHGIFFDGQIFDAYKFVSDLFRTAEKSIIIADNYIDDTVLVHLTKLKKGVRIKIITKSISDQFRLDIKKFESQYFPVEVKVLKNIHDRFIIIDGEVLYFFGASLKDLGKKLFGFMKMGISELKKVQDNI